VKIISDWRTDVFPGIPRGLTWAPAHRHKELAAQVRDGYFLKKFGAANGCDVQGRRSDKGSEERGPPPLPLPLANRLEYRDYPLG
jgi:hypothetical protein